MFLFALVVTWNTIVEFSAFLLWFMFILTLLRQNVTHYSCISLLLPRLPKLPGQFYSNGLGNMASPGNSKEIQP